MGTTTAQPTAHGSARRIGGDGRLDPVRRHRPVRASLLRLAAVAALLVTAALASWSPAWAPAHTCAPQAGAAAVPPPESRSAAAPSREGSPDP